MAARGGDADTRASRRPRRPRPVPAANLRVVPLIDPVVDGAGHDPRSEYVETYWLGVLGPTATWLVRRLVARLEESPEGFELDAAALSAELGLGGKIGPNAPFVRTVQRCVRFGAAELTTPERLRVRRKLPPLTRFQLTRLPAHLQEAHAARTAALVRPPSPAVERSAHERREEARGAALSLLSSGLSPEGVEQALHSRAVHPALAHEAVAWAASHPVSQRVRPGDLPPEAA